MERGHAIFRETGEEKTSEGKFLLLVFGEKRNYTSMAFCLVLAYRDHVQNLTVLHSPTEKRYIFIMINHISGDGQVFHYPLCLSW